MNELYERIENMARRRGLNITQLCIQSGASRGSLGDLKHGRIDSLKPVTLKRLADFFGVSIDELLGTSVDLDATLTEALDVLRTRPECLSLVMSMKDASPEAVNRAIRVLEAVKT